jgi:rhamnosyltransferase
VGVLLRNILAIVVTFNPDRDVLERLLDRLNEEEVPAIVVDNGSREIVADWLAVRAEAVSLLALGDNFGIATAQNRGIAAARARGSEAVVLFDQDSLPPAGMIASLAEAAARLAEDGVRLAAIGPCPVDARLARPVPPGRPEPLPVDHLIASGCLVPLAAFDVIGPLRDDLFIDYVDIEWCLRAATLGYRCYMLPSLIMAHEFGTPRRVFGRAFVSHGPARHYYLFRNSVWLWRQTWVPAGWRWRKLPRLILRLGFNILFATPRREQWTMMARGLADGMAGRLGRRVDP